ncbi:MAG TPA: RNA polymerase sigma-54 factor, partial [Bacteroidia bacterium]|nr:RNA polymerase sigma-54 factor [Bacteroidia bacterium]
MLKQNLTQKLLQKLSPQQIQFIKLLQLSTQDFEQRLEQEMIENPALESGKEGDELEFQQSEAEAPAKEEYEDFDSEGETEADMYEEADRFDIDEYMGSDDDRDSFRLYE